MTALKYLRDGEGEGWVLHAGPRPSSRENNNHGRMVVPLLQSASLFVSSLFAHLLSTRRPCGSVGKRYWMIGAVIKGVARGDADRRKLLYGSGGSSH